MHKEANLTLTLRRSRSTQDHYLNKIGRPNTPNATYQVPRSSAFWFWKWRFLKGFTIYGHGGHLGLVTKTIWTNFRFRVLRSLHMKFEFNWPSGFRGEDVWKCWWTDDRRRTTDGRTDNGVTGILLAHPWAFGSGELKSGTASLNKDSQCSK